MAALHGGLDVTSAERGRHSPLLTWGHPAPHAVHRALLPCEGDFELAPLEILPWEECKGKSITLRCECPALAGSWCHTRKIFLKCQRQQEGKISPVGLRETSYGRQQVTEAWATKDNHSPSTTFLSSS